MSDLLQRDELMHVAVRKCCFRLPTAFLNLIVRGRCQGPKSHACFRRHTFIAFGNGAMLAVQLLRDFRALASSSESLFTGSSIIGFSSKDVPFRLCRASAALSAASDILQDTQPSQPA